MSEPAEMTVGVYLVELLKAYGVDTVFGIPGVHTVELYRGLGASGLRHVAARHEGSLGFMADGYARVTGKPGVCFVITGPGLSNIATAMGQAYADSIPLLVISATNAGGDAASGRGHLHEMKDQPGLGAAVSAFSRTLHRAADLPETIARAFALFDGARPRPVHIELPLDVLGSSASDLPPISKSPVRLKPPAARADLVDEARTLLAGAKSPLILIGGGAIRAGDGVDGLAEALDAPVVMTINARGVLPVHHPLAVSWSASMAAVRKLIQQSDVILALGTELGPTDYDIYADKGFCLPGKLIRVDLDAEQLVRSRQPDLAIIGDAADFVRQLNACGATSARTVSGAARVIAVSAEARIELTPDMTAELAFLEKVRDAAPGAVLVGDSTQQVYAGNLGFAAERPRSWFNSSVGFGALGYGLPAAVGASLGDPSKPVICLAGDGGVQFSIAELAAAKETGARLILILLNNQGYGEIKTAMQAVGVAPVGVDLYTPNFQMLAAAYGWRTSLLGDRSGIGGAIEAALAAEGPSLIEVSAP